MAGILVPLAWDLAAWAVAILGAGLQGLGQALTEDTVYGDDGQLLTASFMDYDNDGVQILRRGYNFTDGTDGLGRLDAGLFFIAFVRDPRTQYVPMQTKLSRDDLLMEYLVHTGSGLFAVPPGVTGPGRWVGQDLFA